MMIAIGNIDDDEDGHCGFSDGGDYADDNGGGNGGAGHDIIVVIMVLVLTLPWQSYY